MPAAHPFRSHLASDDDDIDLGWTCAECGCATCRGELADEPTPGDRAHTAQNARLPAPRRTRYPFPTS